MRVVLTGSGGFLGSHLVETFRSGGHDVFPVPSVICDLRELNEAQTILTTLRPDLLIHAAAMCGGLGFNAPRQAEMLRENLLLSLQTLEAARLSKIPLTINICSSCAYPDLQRPLKEEDLWAGLPHTSVLGYGIAKRLQHHLAALYQLQYGMRATTVILSNLYGERDHFDERSHVVAALIRRFVVAKEQSLPEVRVWGTGMAVREMLYVKDAAEGILRVVQDYNSGEKPLNLGTGRGHTVAEIAAVVKEAVGYPGQVVFDSTKPDGQLFKVMDVSRMREQIGWEPPTSLETGVQRTVEWYLAHRQ